MIKLTIAYPAGSAAAAVQRLDRDLKDKSALHAEVAPAIERLSRDWIAEQAKFRHATAARLGGKPTGELGRAVSKVASSSDASGATVEFGSPLLARAFGDVKIRPGAGKKYLTIPISGEAYGVRMRRFPGKLRFLGKPGAKALVAAEFEKGRKIGTAHYLLVKDVNQKQDESLLPSDRAYLDSAMEAIAAFILHRWQQP
jgi:hypothetical protein